MPKINVFQVIRYLKNHAPYLVSVFSRKEILGSSVKRGVCLASLALVSVLASQGFEKAAI